MLAVLIGLAGIPMMAQQDIGCEYFIGSDPGLGKAIHVNATIDGEGNMRFSIPDTQLSDGYNLVGIRTYHKTENGCYFSPTVLSYTIKATSDQVNRIEYFWDEDPGFGKGTVMEYVAGEEVTVSKKIPTEGLAPGYHKLGIRAAGVEGWGPTVIYDVVVSGPDQAVNRIEYFWDEDPGIGMGKVMEYEAGEEVTVKKKIPTEGLTPGNHKLGIRAAGISGWGPTVLYDVVVSGPDEAVNRVEYFWDEDPGFGKGIKMECAEGDETTVIQKVSTEGLAPGYHQLGIRAAGINGWGPTLLSNVLVSKNGLINNVEYFWDKDPGFGMGTPLAITPGEEIDLEADIPTDGLTPGNHKLGVRTRGESGWSPTTWHEVILRENAEIECAEYFWGTDPGYGKGTPIAITRGEEVTLDDFEIPTDENVHGDAVLGIRFFGAAGWSPTLSYIVAVDAEGNYTLDTEKETNFEERNFQDLAAMLDDFSSRGIGGDVTINAANSGTTYALDMTVEGQQEKLTAMADDLEQGDLWMTFTAAEGSNNTLSITTSIATKEDIANVIRFFSRTYLNNIKLLINGVEFNFNALKSKGEVICSGEETAGVAVSSISTALTATWTAQPGENSTLSGYAESGSGDLVPGVITNTGTKADSLVYVISFADAMGNEVLTTGYKIKVYSKLAGRQFTGMSPAAGASLDPVTATLKWGAISDATGGYELTVESREDNDETGATLSTETLQMTTNSHAITLKEGYVYTWRVKAKGYCDETVSGDMTFTARRLADLTVTEVTVPEYAEAGNTITVKATISNIGGGSTVKTSWTDKLYYTIDSEDFATAVAAQSLTHSGNIAVGESYEQTFSFKVPEQDAGVLRLYVVTDDGAREMENDTDNNRKQSADVTLKPFLVNADDLAALRKLYSDFGGEQWSGTKWDVSSELIKTGNWSGVTFNTEGRVTAINLTARGLTGTLTADNAPQFAVLTSLNLSRNSISGDASMIAGEGMPMLKTLDLSYNKIDALTKALPSGITSLNLGYQYRIYKSNSLPYIDDMTSQALKIGGVVDVELSSLMTYSHADKNFSYHPNFTVYSRDLAKNYGSINYSSASGNYSFSNTGSGLVLDQDADVALVVSNGAAANMAVPATIHYTMGDANISGVVDVNDVQRTLNYMFNVSGSGLMNVSAANTFSEEEATPLINVQDIVCTVNIILDDTGAGEARAARRAAAMSETYDNNLLMNGRTVQLQSMDDIAALDIELAGVSSSQIRLLLNSADFTMQSRNTAEGVHVVIFSPTGAFLPAGTTDVIKCSREVTLLSAAGSSPLAENVNVGVNLQPTSIGGIGDDNIDIAISADGEDLIVESGSERGATHIIIYTEAGEKVGEFSLNSLAAGVTRLHTNGVAGSRLCIVKVRSDNDVKIAKVIFKPNSKQ